MKYLFAYTDRDNATLVVAHTNEDDSFDGNGLAIPLTESSVLAWITILTHALGEYQVEEDIPGRPVRISPDIDEWSANE